MTNQSETPISQAAREPSQYQTAMMIADQLGETQPAPRYAILRIVNALGRTQSRQLLDHALEIEEQGGMMLSDGSRRRMPGGIFFDLVYAIGKPKPDKSLPLRKKPRDLAEEAKKPDAQKAKAKNTQVPKKASKKPASKPAIAKKSSPKVQLAATARRVDR